MSDLGTRTDCTRDDGETICRNASLLGYSTNVAKRGCWVVFDNGNPEIRFGRVVGRVHCEGKTYVEVIGLNTAISGAYVRWVDPDQITACHETLPLDLLKFMFSDWGYREGTQLLERAARGFVRNDSDAERSLVPLDPFECGVLVEAIKQMADRSVRNKAQMSARAKDLESRTDGLA